MGEQNPFWCLLQDDILWMIMQLLDILDYHNISAVCKNWNLACKKICPRIPNDPIPWLVTKQNAPFWNTYIRIYRPLTNKSYKIDMPELADTRSCCLYSKDAWLLIDTIDCIDDIFLHSFLLLNLFTQSKIYLPTMKKTTQLKITNGAFSTALKSPTCVVIIAWDIIDRTTTTDIYAWKIGSNTWSWKTYQHSWDRIFIPTMWLCDDHLYFFYDSGVIVFDYDLNLKRSNVYSFQRDSTFTMTESNKELFAVARDLSLNMFDQFSLDWCHSNVRILICFKSTFKCTSIGVMVKDKWDQVLIQVKNLKKSHGCRLLTVKGEQVVVVDDRCSQTWLNL